MSNIIQSPQEAHELPIKFGSYVVGFILSVATTLIAFFSVQYHLWNTPTLIGIIIFLALVQLAVQMIFFLHVGREKGTRWKLITFAFAALVVLIVVIGSLWIMANLNYNMMRMTPEQQKTYMQQNEGI